MSNDNNNQPKKKGKVRLMKKYSDTSVRLNLRVEPEERESFKKLQELLKEFAGGKRISVGILMRRMMNMYTAHLADIFIPIQQQVEAGYMKKADQPNAIRKAMEPEIAALLRAGGHRVKEVK